MAALLSMVPPVPSPTSAAVQLFKTFIASTMEVIDEAAQKAAEAESAKVSSVLADKLETKYLSLITLDGPLDNTGESPYLSQLLAISDLNKNITIMSSKISSLPAQPSKQSGGGAELLDNEIVAVFKSLEEQYENSKNGKTDSKIAQNGMSLSSIENGLHPSMNLTEVLNFWHYIVEHGKEIIKNMLRNVLQGKVQSLMATRITPLYQQAIDKAVERVRIDYQFIQKVSTQLEQSSNQNWKILDAAIEEVNKEENPEEKQKIAQSFVQEWSKQRDDILNIVKNNLTERANNEMNSMRSPPTTTPTPTTPQRGGRIAAVTTSADSSFLFHPRRRRESAAVTRKFARGIHQPMKPYFIFDTSRPGKIKSRRLYR